jgi:Xaa-Pro aminopeptidase
MTERALQVEVEAEFFRGGSARTAYGSIVGGGPNGAVLHFSPTMRPFREGELVLMDAAAEWDGYAADVTRTFPVSGNLSGVQRDLYSLVLHVQQAAIDDVAPGKEYRELHMEAATRMAAGLADLGILRGAPESLVERDAHAIFFPHGLGHMLGLSTHDAGGCLAGRAPSDRFGLKWLRADLPLEEGYVVTIEPGVYFIRALLTSSEWRARYRDEVNWPLVDTMLDFGGIRIEDDVLVTADGADVLSAEIPKDMETIEALRRDGASA